MNVRHAFLAITVAAGACLLAPGSARADMMLYDSSNLIQGRQSFTEAFSLTTPGTLSVTLGNVPWLDSVQDLTFFLTSTSGVIGNPMGLGTESMDLNAGTYYAHWFGDAAGTYSIAVATLSIVFHPNVATVPLPGSLGLLAAGLGLLGAYRRRASGIAAPALG